MNAKTKITKAEAEYVKDARQDLCKECIMFIKPMHCMLVHGVINAYGHCKYFKVKYKMPVGD